MQFTLGSIARSSLAPLPALAVATLGSRRVPAVQPQPILAPLTPAAIFLVVTIDDGGEATVHDALPDMSGLVRAVGFRDPTKRLSADRLDRLRRLGPAVRRTAAGRAAPVRRAERAAAHAPRPRPGDLLFHIRAESMDVCFELAGRILEVDGRRGHRRRRGARLPVLRRARPARLRRRHREPGRAARRRAPPRSATRIPTSPAAATCSCRSTCTT